MKFDIKKFPIGKFDSILERGLSNGLGSQGGQVCIEAAICEAMNLPHGDDPGCVASSVRLFKIELNDSQWSSAEARAKGLRDLGLAQLGSLGVVDDVEFTVRLSKKIISVLIPKIFRQSLSGYPECLAAAKRCEDEGTPESAAESAWSAESARSAARSAWSASAASASAASAASAARSAAESAGSAWSAESARSAARSAWSAAWSAQSAAWSAQSAESAGSAADAYLSLAANLALETLRELNSPGIDLL
jgi:hypothetical protein